MSTLETKRYRRRMLTGMKAQIRHYERCLPKLAKLDPEVLAAGMDMFEDGMGLASWLSHPARSLGGKIPLNVLRTKTGRAKVAEILRALSYGAYI